MKTSLRFLGVMTCLAWVCSTALGGDMFLKIDGIEGESTDQYHPKEIVVTTYQQAVTQTGTTATGGGGGAGKASLSDFKFTKPLDKASPKLFLACAQGQHLKSAVLTVRKPTGKKETYYTVTLTDVWVTSVQNGADTSGNITEAVTLGFAKIEWAYTPTNDKGQLGSPVKAYWDLKMNKGG